jgi:hypothetical protein
MLSIHHLLESNILQIGPNAESDVEELSPEGDKLDKQIIKNAFTGGDRTHGEVDPKASPPNPDAAYKYVNTPLERITKTRI